MGLVLKKVPTHSPGGKSPLIPALFSLLRRVGL